MLRKLLFLLFSFVTIVAMGQTAQTKKQSLPEQPGFVLQDGTVYTVDQTMTLDGNSTGGFINGLAVADGATVTLYIPTDVTLTVKGQNADGQHGAGAGIYVPASSTLYITGEGKLVAIGGNGGNGGNGGDGQQGSISGSNGTGGIGGTGGYGGGGAAAAIGGNGGEGGGTTEGAPANSASRKSDGANGVPMLPTSTDYNGKDGDAGATMGNVYILGKVIVETSMGSSGAAGGAAGTHGIHNAPKKGNIYFSIGGGGAGAGGGAGLAASYGIGGGGAGAGGGAAGGSGAVDKYSNYNSEKNLTDANVLGSGGSATGAGQGAVNGLVITTGDIARDNGAYNNVSTSFPRYGGYGGTVGGKPGAQGGNGTVYVEADSETDLTGATIGNKVVMSADAEETALSALNVNIKLNFLNDGDPNSGVLNAKFGEPYEQLPAELIPTRSGYDFVGYFTQAVGGTQLFDKDGKPATTGARCMYVQDENPTLYAHWILSTYTITWNYQYYDVDKGGYETIPENERSTQANVVIRLTDGSTHTMVMTNPTPSQIETTHTVTLRNELTDEIFNKVVAVDKVEPIEIGSTNKVLMTLDYVSESSAKIFYDPTRYMVKWNVSVNATEKPEYIILTVKRGTTDATADGDIPTDGDYAEDANIFRELRIRKNASGTYSGSAVLKYEQDGSTPFHYSVSVVGVRDDSGHDYMFPTAVSSSAYKESGIMYCSKPSEQNPSPSRNIEEIEFTIDLKKLILDPNGGTLDDGSPEKIWAPTDATVTLKNDENSYPYTATRLNYNFEGWATTENATVGLDNITLASDQTVYAVFMDRTPPTITFGDYTRNGAANNYRVPVTISDAISTQNVVYYAVYDNNPGDIPADDPRWGDQKGKTTKKAEVVNIDFTSTSVVYVHVKAVDESGNAAVASKEIKVDSEAPVIRAYPNVDSFCAINVDVDVTDNVGVTSLTISPNTNVTQTTEGNITSVVLPKPSSGSTVYTLTAKDAAGNETVRTITIYAAHDFINGTDIAATEPTATAEGYYRYKKCAHCSHIILLRGDSQKEIDITDEGQRGAWIIPAGVVMLMEPYNGTFDIVDYDTYVNTALTKTNTVTSATQVRLSKDTQIASNTATSFVTPNRNIDLELNGHGLMTGNNSTGSITGNSKVTILLSDGNNRGKADGHTKEYATDIIPYTNKSTVTGSPVKYTRVFSSIQQGKWQALYLPFAFTYNTSDFNLAQLDNDKDKDFEAESDGHIVLRVKRVETNTTIEARTPLFISSGTDELELEVTGQTLQAATSHTTNHSGMFIGTLYDSPVSVAENPFWVLLNNGNMWYAQAGQTQRPYRWVIQPTGGSNVKSISFQVVDDASDIKEVNQKRNDDGNIYTIDGRKVPAASSLQPGIYIVNGKKMVIK